MRHLATIRKINSLEPIPNKDRIELAHIDGWQAIVNKGEFQEGELIIFCEPDSVLPRLPEYTFLEKYNYRIKTIKLAGVISQGLILKTDKLKSDFKFGDDVTEQLNIKQYEPLMDKDPPIKEHKNSWLVRLLMRFSWFRAWRKRWQTNHTEFPSFIKKTDEERIQNRPDLLNDKDALWIGTEKLDGCSATYFLRKKFLGYEFGVCSRNLRLAKPDDSVYWRMAEKYNIREKMERLIDKSEWLVIQGECIGPRIQKNIYHLTENQFRVYSIITPKGRLNSSDSWELCSKNQLQHVPLVTDTKGISLYRKSVNEVLQMATGDTVLCSTPTLREGIVYRSILGDVSFKAVSPSYLLKHEG